ncbi:hypothetical protein ACGFNU_38355 [Spirillospora sp. NPDC048911]|uniref:hypothetical protein n=1 Tax=Spirillospora sp. NPDC048911 TaxID=3364527 RepID=UPI0037222F65
MLKKLSISGLAGSAAFMAFAAAPAQATTQAHDDPPGSQVPGPVQIVGVQTCRGIDIAGIGAAIHNILGMTYEYGDCINGSTVNWPAHKSHHHH